jgi:hypothetical protein
MCNWKLEQRTKLQQGQQRTNFILLQQRTNNLQQAVYISANKEFLTENASTTTKKKQFTTIITANEFDESTTRKNSKR